MLFSSRMATCRRAVKLGIGSAGTQLLRPNHNGFGVRPISELSKTNSKRLFLVDTLAFVRKLEAQGIPSKHAEALVSVLADSWENSCQYFVSKVEMEKSEMTHQSDFSKFKIEVKSSQDFSLTLLQRENEKLRDDIEKMRSAFRNDIDTMGSAFRNDIDTMGSAFRNDIDKLRSELRYEIDKVTAGQRLDLNLEKGRIRDELTNQSQETVNVDNKLDREIQALKAYIEASKYEVIKYCIGTLVSVSAVSLAVVRILM